MKKIWVFGNYVLLFFALIIFNCTRWVIANFSFESFDEIIFTITSPLEGTGNGMIWGFIKENLTWPFIIVLLIYLFSFICKRYNFEIDLEIFKKKFYFDILHLKFYSFLKFVPIILFILAFIFMGEKLYFFNYLKYQLMESNFIEENYVAPESVNIKFPEKKKNLIYIYLESMEMTFADKDNGGAYDVNYISELSSVARKNINFSNTDNLGGAYVVGAATWTIGAMVAQTTGLPLKSPFNGNMLTRYYDEILPGAMSLGEILEDNGYKNYIMFGSNASFAGRDVYFKNHGNYEIYDYYRAIDDGIIDDDYYVFWGFEDAKLFPWAKKVLKNISKKDEPFNFTLLTVDTHAMDGYTSDFCEEVSNDVYLNAIACSSHQVGEFIKWLEKQSFYKDTTIIIVGDHLSMNNYSFNSISNYERNVYNTFINSSVSSGNTNNREFSTMDYFPTTLASLGVTIENDRLGLGTNLFSDNKTILEEFGKEEVSRELAKNSRYYNRCFVNNDCN